jgi:hypothetical protein
MPERSVLRSHLPDQPFTPYISIDADGSGPGSTGRGSPSWRSSPEDRVYATCLFCQQSLGNNESIESERRAHEGELNILEEAWREAEEVAAISDDLILPPGTREFIEKIKADL